MEILLESALGFFLVVARTTGLLMALPSFSEAAVPVRARMAMALVFAFAAWNGAGAFGMPEPASLADLAFLGFVESAIGLTGGLAARMALLAVVSTGDFAAKQIGLGYGAMASPVSGVDFATISRLLHFLTFTTAIGLGFHQKAILWLASGLVRYPPGTPFDFELVFFSLAMQTIDAISLGLQLAFPLAGGAVIAKLLLGVISRTAPQLQLMSMSFSLSLLAGLYGLYLTTPIICRLVAENTIQTLMP